MIIKHFLSEAMLNLIKRYIYRVHTDGIFQIGLQPKRRSAMKHNVNFVSQSFDLLIRKTQFVKSHVTVKRNQFLHRVRFQLPDTIEQLKNIKIN